MDELHGHAGRTRPWAIPMRARDPKETHRTATPLELLFDLVVVVAVAQAAAGLHHGLSDGAVSTSVRSYAVVFFAIWWAWMHVAWFASAYDTDDGPYRLVVFTQLAGALLLAAGVAPFFATGDMRMITAGYTVMRLAQVTQWLRAARGDPARRTTAVRFAVGQALVQLGWIALLAAPPGLRWPGFGALVLAELTVPIWAERAGATPWHPEHIVERYGLFTLIVLGESILAGTLAVQAAVAGGAFDLSLLGCIGGGLLIVVALWWLAFGRPAPAITGSARAAYLWGYGHYVIFAATAAVGAGLAVTVDVITGHAAVGAVVAGMAVAVPVALVLLVRWALERVPGASVVDRALHPSAALLVLSTPWWGQPVLAIGLVLAALLTVMIVREQRPGRLPLRPGEPAS